MKGYLSISDDQPPLTNTGIAHIACVLHSLFRLYLSSDAELCPSTFPTSPQETQLDPSGRYVLLSKGFLARLTQQFPLNECTGLVQIKVRHRSLGFPWSWRWLSS